MSVLEFDWRTRSIPERNAQHFNELITDDFFYDLWQS